ncbi:hypothetical protein VTN96DRAFT_7077 [Rasamsonia emersonii]|uniref:Uncharacterized protein n=1 Tax=Rasamsonia emersonii (strain ATCC 16479 / CBS 393.64 / IMI 116815) TaxID=1408163 RepID=A0A0F4YUP4_RASE3|nr:hypothetical protein T310_4363 [Rasamsonia emersonii CBS 393.64]KKA21576.1 hypothetical protein T310_4363 [Rasamsonia emersonii CBS 393.64]
MSSPSAPQVSGRPGRKSRRCRLCCCCCCSCISICFLLTVILPAASVFLLTVRPMIRALRHEAEYFGELEEQRRRDRDWDKAATRGRMPWMLEVLEAPVPWNDPRRRRPLIHDITQLMTGEWKTQMRLNDDGTAEFPQLEYWIYVGGTSRGRSLWSLSLGDWRTYVRDIYPFPVPSPPGPSCADEPAICTSFNAAFDRLLELYHTHRVNQTGRGDLVFADCDVSPMLCDELRLSPLMLVHVQTQSPCGGEMEPEYHFVCPVKWRFVSLPLKKMPFQRTVRLSALLSSSSSLSIKPASKETSPGDSNNDHVVPVFPSAFEQLHSLVSYDGSVEALDVEENQVWEIVVDGPTPKID